MMKKYKAMVCSMMAFAIGVTQIPVTNFPVYASVEKVSQTSTFYYNGDIITVDEAKGETKSGTPIYAKGVLTKDGKIQEVAYSNDELKKLEKEAEKQNSSRVDLKGDTLVPGFFDSHSHLDMVDKYYDASPAAGVTSIDSLIVEGKKQLADWKQKNKTKLDARTEEDQYWFITHGFDNTAFEKDNYRMPTKEDLDKISTEYPIVYIHASDHLAAANSLALKLFNQKIFKVYNDNKSKADAIRKFWDIQDGSESLEKTDDTSGFTGILRENGFFAVFYSYYGIYGLADDTKYLGILGENKDITAQALQTYAKNGVTTANGNVSSVISQLGDSQKIIDVYNDTSYDAVKNNASVTPSAEAGYNTDHVKTGPIKIFLDGSPQGKTAWFEEDTTDASHGGYYRDGNETILDGTEGKEYWWGGEDASKISDEKLTEQFSYAVQHKLQVVAHANGTAAISQFINSYREALTEAGVDVANKEEVQKIGNEVRPVIIHAQTITQKQLTEAEALDINLSFFTDHVYYYGDYHLYSTLGPVRGQLISPMKDALEKDVNVTMHQDSPVAPPNMLFSIFNAANRITRDGQAIGRGSANGNSDARITKEIDENVKNDTKDERISGYEALKAVTINGAWQNFEEDKKGSISEGKEADFVIINKNPTEEEFLGLSTTEAQKNQFIQETINDDKVIYRAQDSNITHSSTEKPAVSTSSASANTSGSNTTVKQPTYKKTSTRKIKVTWKKKSGAKGYVIYAKAGNGKYKKITAAGRVTKKTLTVNAGYSYKFKVKPYKNVKKNGKTVKKYYKAYRANGKNGKKTVRITYKNITGYEGYVIYVKTGKGAYRKGKTTTKGGTITYTNKNAKIGKSYKFQLKGYKTVKGKKIYTTIKAKKA